MEFFLYRIFRRGTPDIVRITADNASDARRVSEDWPFLSGELFGFNGTAWTLIAVGTRQWSRKDTGIHWTVK